MHLDLTVLILTKDEESNIAKCIDSLKGIAKRIVIVDSFSTDKTCAIARSKGADVYQHAWENHAAQFNWGLENTSITTEWVLRLDADEELTDELCKEMIVKIPQLQSPINGILLKRRVYFMGKWIKWGGVYPIFFLRLIRNHKGYCELALMDEHLMLYEGETIQFSHDFIDKNTKSLTWWIEKHNWYATRESADYLSEKQVLSNRRVRPNLFGNNAERKRWLKYFLYYKVPLFLRARLYFMYRYYFRLGFLDGTEGKIFHFLQGYWYRFLVDAKIYEHYMRTNNVKKN